MVVEIARLDHRALESIANSATVERQVRRVAEVICDTAQQLAPVASGNLRAGIETEDERVAGLLEVRVGWTHRAWYGRLVETGTQYTRPQPHLRPAAIKVAGGRTRVGSD